MWLEGVHRMPEPIPPKHVHRPERTCVMRCDLLLYAVFAIACSLCVPERATAVPVFWSPLVGGNGHYYEVVLTDFFSQLPWTGARDAAAARSYDSLPGHLVTITSPGEQG